MPGASHSPHDAFPPFGYLDNPYHSWKLNPAGVLRSRPPAGMGWHRPNHGSYGRNQFQDRAHLYVGVQVGSQRLLASDDFRRARLAPRCDLHTKNRLRYVWKHPAGVLVRALFFLIAEDALGCQITLERPAGEAGEAYAPLAVRLWLAQELAHNPATSRLWEHGPYVVPPGALPDGASLDIAPLGLVGIVPEGDAWVHGLADVDGVAIIPDAALPLAAPELRGLRLSDAPRGREPEGLQTAGLLLGYDVTLTPGASFNGFALLARGVSADAALAHWRADVAAFSSALAAHAADDEAFWAHAPQLTGDWPAHWRRGFATDLETLRMVVRPPVGVFAGRWDGMQVQAPRLVLAEAALDALALSWADPALARALLLECFTSARRPNVPCMREDSSYNMVADDGAICGTGPEWGWPLLVADLLWVRSGDSEWLAAIYPHLAAYMEWWLTQRVDAAGWLVHVCSWESGQDVSARFGEQQTGGSDVRHLRPVDLLAAAAHACALLAGWAATLDLPASERERWQAVSARLHTQLESMWHDGWFHDFDTRRGRWSDVRDPMHLAPLLALEATSEQRDALRAAFDALPPHGGVWPPLAWPPVAFTVLRAAQVAGLPARAAELATEIVERAWRRMDARELEPDGALPGVTREFWPEGGPENSAGIEGYGWGALTADVLIRHIIGVCVVTPRMLILTPALPLSLRVPGATYTVGPLTYGGGTLSVSYAILAAGSADAIDVSLTLTGVTEPFSVLDGRSNAILTRAAPDAAGTVRLRWRGAWLVEYQITAYQ